MTETLLRITQNWWQNKQYMQGTAESPYNRRHHNFAYNMECFFTLDLNVAGKKVRYYLFRFSDCSINLTRTFLKVTHLTVQCFNAHYTVTLATPEMSL